MVHFIWYCKYKKKTYLVLTFWGHIFFILIIASKKFPTENFCNITTTTTHVVSWVWEKESSSFTITQSAHVSYFSQCHYIRKLYYNCSIRIIQPCVWHISNCRKLCYWHKFNHIHFITSTFSTHRYVMKSTWFSTALQNDIATSDGSKYVRSSIVRSQK